jgi:hypothetical protein
MVTHETLRQRGCSDKTKGESVKEYQQRPRPSTLRLKRCSRGSRTLTTCLKYLPPVVDVSIEGPSVEDAPGQRIRATLEYPEGGSTFDSEGYLAVDEGRKRMKWGAEIERDYSGWLDVADAVDG